MGKQRTRSGWLYSVCQWKNANCDSPHVLTRSSRAICRKEAKLQKENISTFAAVNKENQDVHIYCDQRHRLEGCNSFLEKTFKKGINFLEKQKSCYKCLKSLTEGFNEKTCT